MRCKPTRLAPSETKKGDLQKNAGYYKNEYISQETDKRIICIPSNSIRKSSWVFQKRRDPSASSEYKWRSGIEGAEVSGGATYFNQ